MKLEPIVWLAVVATPNIPIIPAEIPVPVPPATTMFLIMLLVMVDAGKSMDIPITAAPVEVELF